MGLGNIGHAAAIPERRDVHVDLQRRNPAAVRAATTALRAAGQTGLRVVTKPVNVGRVQPGRAYQLANSGRVGNPSGLTKPHNIGPTVEHNAPNKVAGKMGGAGAVTAALVLTNSPWGKAVTKVSPNPASFHQLLK